mmetsp:Transcript_6948/g.19352  ORF Transcript_6948/g.19352 Transcript_6948/m.19352 type:complete len:209 (-) Transcript_6948:1049-1675(-)
MLSIGPQGPSSFSGSHTSPLESKISSDKSPITRMQASLGSKLMPGNAINGSPRATWSRRSSTNRSMPSARTSPDAPLSALLSALSGTSTTRQALRVRKVAIQRGKSPKQATSPNVAPAVSKPTLAPALVRISTVPDKMTSMAVVSLPITASVSPAPRWASDKVRAMSCRKASEHPAKNFVRASPGMATVCTQPRRRVSVARLAASCFL